LLDDFIKEETNITIVESGNTMKILALKFRISDKIILDNVVGGLELMVDCSQNDSIEFAFEKCPLIMNNDLASSSKEDDKVLLQKFNRFIDSLDMPVRIIEAVVVDNMRLGVIAKEDINEDEIYLSIKSSSVINTDTATVDGKPQLNSILDYHRSLSQDGGLDVLLLFLLHEKFISKERSKWAPYIDVFPTIEDMKQ